jgi:3-oxoacyl-[acyl-carrier-protein] synthase II
MKAMITGVGWVNNAGRGQGRQSVFNPGGSEGRLDLSRKGVFDKPISRYGRMDHYSKLGLLAISMALKDARLDQWTEMRNIAIMASTVYGCLQTDVDYYDTVMTEEGRLASPNIFAYTLSNTYLGEAAIYFGLTGAAFIINEGSISGFYGLLLAMNSLARGECEAVITGICDAGPPSSLGLTGRAVPGALFFVLQPASDRQAWSYGTLTQEEKGDIFFEGKTVEALPELAVWCTQKLGIRFKV